MTSTTIKKTNTPPARTKRSLYFCFCARVRWLPQPKMSGFSLLELSSCKAWATSSLPVPLSPRISTVTSVVASRSIVRQSFSISGSPVIMRPVGDATDCERNRRFSASSW